MHTLHMRSRADRYPKIDICSGTGTWFLHSGFATIIYASDYAIWYLVSCEPINNKLIDEPFVI